MRGGLLVLFCVGVAMPAAARSQVEVPYALRETFHTAARFIRVDRGCTVTDKDAESAFITFECPGDDGKVKRGALEIISGGKSVVRLQITLGDEPRYIELRFLELLGRKLRDERGTPVPPSVKTPAPPHAESPDAGGQ